MPHEQKLLFQLGRKPAVICVKKSDIASQRLLNAVITAHGCSKIFLILNDPDLPAARRRLFDLSDQFQTAVSAAVVDQNQLPVTKGLRFYGADRLFYIFFCVIDGDDDRYQCIIWHFFRFHHQRFS